MGLVVGGDGDGHREPVGVARLGQEGLGLLHVVGVVVGQALVKVLPESGVHAGADEAAVAVKGQVQNLLPVHGVAQGLADPHVVKGLLGVVEVHGLDQVHGALFDVEVVSQLGHLGAGQMGEEVHGPALEAHENAVRVFDNFIGNLIQIGFLTPVVLEALQDDVVLSGPGDELEGPRPHGGGVLPVVLRREDG